MRDEFSPEMSKLIAKRNFLSRHTRNEFSPEMLELMRQDRMSPESLKRIPLPEGSPQTATIALPGLRAYEDSTLSGTNAAGYMFGNAPLEDTTLFLRKDRDPVTVAHEAEHLLAKRGLEHPTEINSMFDSLVGDKRGSSTRHQFVIDAVQAYPYLQDKYGLQSAYFDPRMYKQQASVGRAQNLLYEQLATLSSIEQTQGVDLTKDPILRETLFRDKDVRETYNALVGLRQTRLDSKDIRPHTRIAEPSMLDKVKKAIGFAEGGEVKDFFGDRDPNEPITPEQIEEFNRYINEHLQKQRKKEEEWDYPYRENDAILAKGYSKGGEATKGSEYDPLFQAAGEKYGVDPSILRAIASVESNFNPQAIGPKTRSGRAQGMMQFVPATAKAYGLEDPFNPEQSVDAAARLMRDLQKQFKGDVGKALEAYNGGPRLVGKSKQTAKYREMVLAKARKSTPEELPPPPEPFMAAKSAPTQLKQGQMYGEAPKTRPEAPRTVSMGTIEAMPLNYRTAFALQYLADNEPDDDPEVKANDLMARLDELELSDGTEGKSALTSFFAETTAPTPTAFQIMQSKKQKQQERQKRALPSMQVVRGFADGGEVDISEQMTVGTLPEDAKDYRELLEGLKRSAADIRRGIQYFPADAVGAPVDIINMGLKPFGLGSDKPFMGSEYLIDKGVEAGIYEKPSGSGVETLTRMAGLPALATRSVGRGIAALEESLKGPPEGIVRPYGGASSVARVGQDDDQSMQYGIYYAMKDLGGLPFENKQAQDAAMRMFDVKARNWFNEQAGTANDPLKQKLYSGKIKPFDPNDKLFPAHLLEAARKAKGEIRESAQIDLEDRYDLMLGVRRIVPEDDTLTASERNTRANQAVIEDRRRILQQLKENPDLILDEHLLTVFKNKDPDKISDAEHLKQVRDKLREAPDIFSARVEPFISKLITSPAERMGVDVIEKSAKYGDIAKEAARRGETFTHGLAAGKISPRNTYNFMHGGPNLFGRSFRELASVAPSIPAKELEKMSFPDFVERSMVLLRKKDEAKNIGQTAQRMLEQDITRALPPELMLKGMSKSPAVSSPPTGTVPTELGPVSSLGWHKLEEPQYANTIALTMKNSVGGYAEYGTYGATSKGRKALETGEAEVYVLYDDKLRPHMTAEVVKVPNRDQYTVYQITGNGPLTSNARHSPYLQGAVDELKSWVGKRTPPVQKAMGGLVSKPLYDRA